jgi:hypothetical protein
LTNKLAVGSPIVVPTSFAKIQGKIFQIFKIPKNEKRKKKN